MEPFPEVELELTLPEERMISSGVRYIRSQLRTAPIIHGTIERTLFTLESLGYPKSEVRKIRAEFEKPTRERSIPPPYVPRQCREAIDEVEKYMMTKGAPDEVLGEVATEAVIDACLMHDRLSMIVRSAKGRAPHIYLEIMEERLK